MIEVLGLLTFPLLLPTHGMDRITGHTFATRSEAIAKNGMVATSQPLATQVAIDILQSGGSAVDAAIAANAVLGHVEPTGCGIGGDLFAIVWDPEEKKLHGLNGSGRSPATLTLEEFERRGKTRIPKRGPLPVSVPGCVDGWFTLHERFGKLPMQQVLAPAIHYAKEGAPITEVIAHYWKLNAEHLHEFPGFQEVYMPGGSTPNKGELFKNEKLAWTYEQIAQDGRDAFYTGVIARRIANTMVEQRGYITMADLAEHRSEWVEPVSTSYRGYDVWELPPNGQGIAALQILNILEGYDIASMGFGSTEHLHAFIEAKKLAFEDRAKFYADPDFNDIPVAELISKEYANERRKLIDLERAGVSYPAGNASLQEGDTIYLSVADKDGMMVSFIQSNYRGMGSGVVPKNCGFILQNRGELFDLTPGRFNTYEPKKRPFHTIIPAFITKDGQPYMSFGVMGGAAQPQMHAQIVMNMIDFGMNLQEAGDAARILHNGSSEPTGERMTNGGAVVVESRMPYESVRALIQMGHKVNYEVGPYGGYQAVLWDAEKGVYFGASESRKDGHAAGY